MNKTSEVSGSFPVNSKRDLTFFLSLVIVAGLFTSNFFRALPSLGMVGLLLLTFLDLEKDWEGQIKKYGGWFSLPYILVKEVVFIQLPKNIRSFWKQKAFLCLSIIFLVHLLSYLQTDHSNTTDFWSNISLKSAMLALPFCYAILPAISKKQFHIILNVYLLLLLISCAYAIVTYLGNMEVYNEAMSRSKPFPVPANHVRFSLMVALGAFCSFYLFKKSLVLISKWEKTIQLILCLFFIGFLHLASVRSGMVVLYIIILSVVLYYTFRSKKILFGLLAIGSLIIISVTSYYVFPTVRNKVDVTLRDIGRTDNVASANYYPMSARIYSYRIGYYLWKEKPLLGVGIANLKREVSKEYIARYPVIFNHIMPHNQYLRYLTSFGLIGFLVFMISFYFPLFYKKNYIREPLLGIHYLIVSLSFLFEGTLETQLGLNFCFIFIVLGLSTLKTKPLS